MPVSIRTPVFVFQTLFLFAIEGQNEWIGISGIPFARLVGSFDGIEPGGANCWEPN